MSDDAGQYWTSLLEAYHFNYDENGYPVDLSSLKDASPADILSDGEGYHIVSWDHEALTTTNPRKKEMFGRANMRGDFGFKSPTKIKRKLLTRKASLEWQENEMEVYMSR